MRGSATRAKFRVQFTKSAPPINKMPRMPAKALRSIPGHDIRGGECSHARPARLPGACRICRWCRRHQQDGRANPRSRARPTRRSHCGLCALAPNITHGVFHSCWSYMSSLALALRASALLWKEDCAFPHARWRWACRPSLPDLIPGHQFPPARCRQHDADNASIC